MDLSLSSFGKIPRSTVAGSYGNSMFFLEETTTLSSKVAVPFLYSHQQRVRVLVLQPYQHLVLSVFKILVITIGV